MQAYFFHLLPYAIASALVFVIAVQAGYAYAVVQPEAAHAFFLKQVEGIVGTAMDFESWELALFIFFGNALTAFIAVALGIAFGIVPFILLVFNGALIGIAARIVHEEFGIGVFFGGIAAHGVIELPAFFLSTAIGMLIGVRAWKRESFSVRAEFKKGLVFYGKIILPLLFVAALIEAFLSPLILDRLA